MKKWFLISQIPLSSQRNSPCDLKQRLKCAGSARCIAQLEPVVLKQDQWYQSHPGNDSLGMRESRCACGSRYIAHVSLSACAGARSLCGCSHGSVGVFLFWGIFQFCLEVVFSI